MPDENPANEEPTPGFLATLKELKSRFDRFVTGGSKVKKPTRTVDTSKVSAKPVRPQPNKQQREAIARSRATRRRKDGT